MLNFIKKLFGFKPPVGAEVAPVVAEPVKVETPAPVVAEPAKKAPAAKAEKPAAPKKPRAPRKPKASA